MTDDILRHRIDRAANGTVEINLDPEEAAFAAKQGWTDENLEMIIHLWTSWDDPITGRPITLLDFMQRMKRAKINVTSIEETADNDIVQVVMHGSVLKAVASYLAGRGFDLTLLHRENDQDLTTYSAVPRRMPR